MSVAGFDFGNLNYVVAIARRGGVDVVTNEVSNRLSPSLVSFDAKQRYIGERGLNQLMTNSKNTVSEIKRLLGRRFNEPELQADLKRFPFKVVDAGEGKLGIQVQYQGELRTFTPEQIAAMILVDMQQIAEANYGSKIVDCVLSVPVYWTDIQRHSLLDAAEIAGLNVLRLMNETSASALGYGIVKTDLPEKDPMNVIFVDIGHASLQIAAVSFVKGKLSVLATVYDRDLGGRTFDDIIISHLAEDWKAKYKIDVYTNPKAILRTRTSVEKVRKVLSANPEAVLNIECLMNDIDVSAQLKRDDVLEWSKPVLDRVAKACNAILEESGLTKDQIAAVELVGGTTRMPAIKTIITEVFGREPFRTTNSEEAVSRGCALQGAMLSPAFKVREFIVNDVTPYPINLSWKSSLKTDAMAVDSGNTMASSVVFQKYNAIPSTKLLSVRKTEPFDVSVGYADPALLAPEVSTYIGKAVVSNFPQTIKDKDAAKVKVKVKMNIHGVVSVDGANLVEEEEVAEAAAPAPAEGASPTTNGPTTDAPAANGPTPIDAEPTSQPAPPASSEEPKAEGEAAAPKKKKVVKKTELTVVYQGPGLTRAEIQEASEAEFKMQLDDRIVAETAEKKNNLESYVYNMRSKLSEDLATFVDPKIKEEFLERLNAMEEWLYDDLDDNPKSVYVQKLEDLQQTGNPIEARHREFVGRPAAVQALEASMNKFMIFATSTEEKYAHIEQAEKDKVLAEVQAASTWVQEHLAKQSSLPKTADPALTVAEIDKKREALEKLGTPIMTKKKPAPPKPTTPTPPPGAAPSEAKPEEVPVSPAQPEAAEAEAAPAAPAADAASAEPMDVEGK